MGDFLVKRDDLRTTRVVESQPPELQAGEALLRVDTFGVTANNVTYAVLGEMMSYWSFFPAEDGWGRVPMWGFAEVTQSDADGLDVETRVYGYLPPSSHVVVRPVNVSERGFVDGSKHRTALPATYQRYASTGADPFYSPATEDLQMVLRPLFLTAFLIDDQLADQGLTDQGSIVFSSASSKTAIGAAYLLARRDDVSLVGLTSARNAEFVEGLGIYDETVTYDAIESIERSPATFVDMAGDGAVRHAVHAHYGDQLVQSITVGVTHWEELGVGVADLPGPAPALFFAPDRAAKRSSDWGAAGLESNAAEAWQPFLEWIGGWLEVIRGHGLEAAENAYVDVLEGRVPPQSAHVISL